MKTGKALLGVLTGLVAGAVLGVIFAPDKGSEAAKNILRLHEGLAGDIKRNIDEKLGELTDRIAGKTGIKYQNDRALAGDSVIKR